MWSEEEAPKWLMAASRLGVVVDPTDAELRSALADELRHRGQVPLDGGVLQSVCDGRDDADEVVARR